MLTTQNISPEFPVGLLNPAPLPIQPQRGIQEKAYKAYVDYLDLPELEVTEEPKKGNCIIHVKANQVSIPAYPNCNCFIKEVKPHSTFLMPKVLDAPRARKSMVIDITRQRWMCKTCGKTATQPLDFMAEGHHQMTQQLLEYLEVQSLLVTSELSLSEETGVFVRTIREIREKFVKRLENEVVFDTPRVLGLDGVRADNTRRRVIFTDIEAGLVLDLLKSGSKRSISERLRKFPGWENIKYVTVDMCKTEIPAVEEALPQAIIIIDPFHIVRTANKMMDAVRNRLYPRLKSKRAPGQRSRPRPEPFRKRRAKLSKSNLTHMEYWFNQCPELRLAYNLKEDYLEIFDDETYSGTLLMCREAAQQLYEEWRNKFPVGEQYKPLLKDLETILKPMADCREYIFNYFDHHYTNAFTESMNRKIKDILRDSRGCNFETMKARIVYGTYLRKQLKAERELERNAIMPHKKRERRQQPNQKGQSSAKGKGEESGSAKVYELPDLRQMAFDFTN